MILAINKFLCVDVRAYVSDFVLISVHTCSFFAHKSFFICYTNVCNCKSFLPYHSILIIIRLVSMILFIFFSKCKMIDQNTFIIIIIVIVIVIAIPRKIRLRTNLFFFFIFFPEAELVFTYVRQRSSFRTIFTRASNDATVLSFVLASLSCPASASSRSLHSRFYLRAVYDRSTRYVLYYQNP